MPQLQQIVGPALQPERAHLPRPEELLTDYARRLQRHRVGRRALWFHLSRLERQNRHESDIQLAANLLLPLAGKYHGEVFALSSGDIVLCLKDPNFKDVDAAVFELQFSFAQDPLMLRADSEGTHVFVTTYDMANRYDAFMARVDEAVAGRPEQSVEANLEASSAALGARLMLSREEMRGSAHSDGLAGHVQTWQGNIAIERLLERRQIAAFPGSKPRYWGLRETVSLEAIDAFNTLALALARHQIDADTALGEVERSLLPEIGEHIRAKAEPNHIIALRIEALMSPEFLMFDRQIGPPSQPKPRIAFWADELKLQRDTADYLKTFLGKRGYELGVTGFGLNDLPELAPMLGECKFLEIDHPREIEVRDAELLSRVLARFGPDGVILSELQSQKSLVIARRAGLKLAAGPIIDDAL